MSPASTIEPQKILVLRLGSMGDIIHSLPAVAALRESLPTAIIGWVVEERWSALLSTPGARTASRGPEKPLVDHVHTVNTLAWRDAPIKASTWKDVRSSIRSMRAVGYDAAIDIQGAIKSSVLGSLARPRKKIGFDQPREGLATFFYDKKVQPTGNHIAERNLELASAVGAKKSAATLYPIPVDPVAEQWADRELKMRGLTSFAILNPGAGWGAKCWPTERYAEVSRRLAASGIHSLINMGPGEESLAEAVVGASQGTAQVLSCTLPELISLTRRASLFIGGDTGPLHLAVALNTPSVALFGPTDPARNGPYGGRAVVLRSPQSSTTYKRSPQHDEGLASISVGDVLQAAAHLSGRNLG